MVNHIYEERLGEKVQKIIGLAWKDDRGISSFSFFIYKISSVVSTLHEKTKNKKTIPIVS